MVSMMQVFIKEHGYKNFEYKPESTVHDVRQMASGFLGDEATNFCVRKLKQPNSLSNYKTFQDNFMLRLDNSP